jgi:hypothetical protein
MSLRRPFIILPDNLMIRRCFISASAYCLFALLLFIASAACADDHPAFYIDVGACPFECCVYRSWRTEKTTTIYAEPKAGSSVVGVAEKGAVVDARTGEVHTRPGKLVVRRDVAHLRKGDILWVYTYLGEGRFKVWHGGRFTEEDIDFDYRNPTLSDWGYFGILPHSVWWVKLRTSKGVEGWTDHPQNFSNKDECS